MLYVEAQVACVAARGPTSMLVEILWHGRMIATKQSAFPSFVRSMIRSGDQVGGWCLRGQSLLCRQVPESVAVRLSLIRSFPRRPRSMVRGDKEGRNHCPSLR